MPVLAIGGDKSFGTMQAEVMRIVASNVDTHVIANAGHWLMEEQRVPTVAAIKTFVD